MTEITVRFAGPVRRPWDELTRALELEGQTTVGQLMETIGYPSNELRYLHLAVNGRTAQPSTQLKECDTLDITLKVGGG